MTSRAESAVAAKFAKIKRAILDSAKAGGEEYANGAYRAKPIVDEHFTAGNQQRYGWAPLSEKYFFRKQHGIHKVGQKGAFLDDTEHKHLLQRHKTELAKSRGLHRLDVNAGFVSDAGFGGSGANLPMLVLFGDLKRAVNSRTHSVVVMPDGKILITFRNLPDYAVYHHEGRGNLPKRSPVEPNEIDRQRVIEAMNRFLDRAFGRSGGAAAVGFNPT